jgi:hypothetical protein
MNIGDTAFGDSQQGFKYQALHVADKGVAVPVDAVRKRSLCTFAHLAAKARKQMKALLVSSSGAGKSAVRNSGG